MSDRMRDPEHIGLQSDSYSDQDEILRVRISGTRGFELVEAGWSVERYRQAIFAARALVIGLREADGRLPVPLPEVDMRAWTLAELTDYHNKLIAQLGIDSSAENDTPLVAQDTSDYAADEMTIFGMDDDGFEEVEIELDVEEPDDADAVITFAEKAKPRRMPDVVKRLILPAASPAPQPKRRLASVSDKEVAQAPKPNVALELMRTVLDARAETDWMDLALCKETDPEAFFPEKGGSTREAKLVCAACDVRSDCLAFALRHDELFGIWGGYSAQERRKFRSRTSKEPAERQTDISNAEIEFMVDQLSVMPPDSAKFFNLVSNYYRSQTKTGIATSAVRTIVESLQAGCTEEPTDEMCAAIRMDRDQVFYHMNHIRHIFSRDPQISELVLGAQPHSDPAT